MPPSHPQTLVRLLLAMALATLSTVIQAGGADNPSLSANSLGFAGASSAAAESVDTVYFNPAGMARMRTGQFSNGLTIVSARMDVRDDGTTRVQDPRQAPCSAGGTCAAPHTTGEAGSFLPRFQAIPDLYAVKPVSERMTLGLGVFTPLGAKVSYKGDWFGSGALQKGTVETVNINPSLAIRLNDRHSIGLGLSAEVVHVYQQASVDVGQAAKYMAEAILQDANNIGLLGLPLGGLLSLGDLYQSLLPGRAKDFLGGLLVQAGGINGNAHVSFDGWGHGFGWNAGYLFELDARTRFGIAYRSQISMPVKGDYDWDFTNVGGTIPNPRDLSQTAPANAYLATYYRPDSTGHTTVIDPQRLSLGFFHSPSPRWDIMADASWTNYGVIRELRLRIDDQTAPGGEIIRQGDTVIPQHWRDTVRLSLGAAHHVSERLTLKAGLAFDQSPVHDERYRHPGGPDSNRYMATLGARLKLAGQTVIDAGYGLIVLEDAKARYHERCTINYFERDDYSAGPKDECTANGGDYHMTYSNGRVHILSVSLSKPL